MGYYTQVTGEITVDPPLSWAEIKDCPFLDRNRDVYLYVEEETVETDEGVLTRKTARAVHPYAGDEFKAYGIEGSLAEIVKAFPDRAFTGMLEGEGERNDDMWRLRVKDGRVEKVVPEIVWPA